ncbi:MAG: hypothetical protein U0Z26_09580 [Anaerolineales bacterium]
MITSIFGWLGIPFGLVFTPYRLFQLMRGGIQPIEANSELLKRLGEKKMQEGNYAVAIECFEASLQYIDTPEVRERLQRLYNSQQPTESLSIVKRYSLYLGIFIGFMILGTLAGYIDYFFSYFIGGSVGNTSLIVGILLWAPFVTMVFLSISLLRCVVEWLVRYTQQTKLISIVMVGVLALVFLIYSLMTGEALGDFTVYTIMGDGSSFSIAKTILTGMIMFFAGGFWYFEYLFSLGETWSIIECVIVVISFVAGIIILWKKSSELAKWQALLANLRGTNLR